MAPVTLGGRSTTRIPAGFSISATAAGRSRQACPPRLVLACGLHSLGRVNLSKGIAPMVTYEIVRESRRGLKSWAIRRLIGGVAQEGTVGAGYQTEAEAEYWLEQLTSADKVDA